MLIRFIVQNLFSFKEATEFNMLPNRIERLSHHKNKLLNIDVLKFATLYGANGAGKSNLVKAIKVLEQIVTSGSIPIQEIEKFKLSDETLHSSTILGIEFINDNKAFYYEIELNNGVIQEEELYISSLGKEDNKLIFNRVTKPNKKTETSFFKAFEDNTECKVLKSVIEKTLIKPDKSLIHLLANLDNDFLNDVKIAYKWFLENLVIIFPDSVAGAISQKLDTDIEFNYFANELINTLGTGVKKINCQKVTLKEFIGEDNPKEINRIIYELNANPNEMILLRNGNEEICIVKEEENIFVKTLSFEHFSENNKPVTFNINEESDGTTRLIEYLPAIKDLIQKEKTFIIDEIERSIHSLTIKEIIKKISLDKNTKGQLIFTTHESNLLDQEFLRQDEIWLTEKNKKGATELYPLSDFKIHHTIDIRKGYLNGRYGGIPFLGNLNDLNWYKYETTK